MPTCRFQSRPAWMNLLPLILLIFAATSRSAWAAVIEVRPDGTGDAPTIQAAIDMAIDGDIVELTDGAFMGDGNRSLDFLGKQITVRSESGNPEVCTIDCEGVARGFYFHNRESGAAVVEGIRIMNGRTTNIGGGIRVDSPASPTIRNCIFFRCRAIGGSGGGIICGGSTLVAGCQFIENYTSLFYGGGVIAFENSTVEDCTFVGNICDACTAGGGVYCSDSAVIQNCVIAGNFAINGGGGAGLGCGHATSVLNCVITGNYSENVGGGVLCINGGSPTIAGCTIAGNRALSAGGGIHVDGVYLQLERTIVWQNCAVLGSGIFVNWGRTTISCCLLDQAEAGFQGEIIYDGPVVNADPLFCEPVHCTQTPTEAGDYTIAFNSPCLEENSPCGAQIGALPAACSPPVPIEETSWGRIKAQYR